MYSVQIATPNDVWWGTIAGDLTKSFEGDERYTSTSTHHCHIGVSDEGHLVSPTKAGKQIFANPHCNQGLYSIFNKRRENIHLSISFSGPRYDCCKLPGLLRQR